MIAFKIEVEAEHDVERFAVEQADRQQVRGQIENQLVLAERIVERLGVKVSRAKPSRLDRQPAMRLVFLFAFQNEVAILPRVEVPQLGKALLHLLEEVQDRVAVIGQLHLGVEVYVDVKLICIRNITIHPDDPE